MHSKLHSITARKLEKALLKDGFFVAHQRGSHKMFVKNNCVVILPMHDPSDSFRRKTLKNILDQASWTEEYLIDLIK
ncbi:MAG: hypothetical protein A2295_00110 [Candidatus Jacksonbacteria bacterium RIFOXYB2_FULL_44_15]|nr:MAG: hypothetical protein UV19_C0005G0017 [Parcubacteria group bacterium GW2011_GWA2_42_28]OGY75823.1 MAG: hypothetical protein A2295_00110 [Candidatus Jacksonbacteria bacterium RIFOXYB2_FULL_44_15]HCE48815.1 hypothetical protein [Candidatus Jacksonbacteria bacterium]HCR15588.1 hypothetical protein [Candidatus Jacksonbacteria bacterium]